MNCMQPKHLALLHHVLHGCQTRLKKGAEWSQANTGRQALRRVRSFSRSRVGLWICERPSAARGLLLLGSHLEPVAEETAELLQCLMRMCSLRYKPAFHAELSTKPKQKDSPGCCHCCGHAGLPSPADWWFPQTPRSRGLTMRCSCRVEENND
jgi:hypothetical protein